MLPAQNSKKIIKIKVQGDMVLVLLFLDNINKHQFHIHTGCNIGFINKCNTLGLQRH